MAIYRPNSPESFEVCFRIRDEWKAKEGLVLSPVVNKYRPVLRSKKYSKRNRKMKVPPELILEVYKMTDEGCSARVISEKIGWSSSTVHRIRMKRDELETQAREILEGIE